jgi:type II secretory pathway predicted ATPase ExeA
MAGQPELRKILAQPELRALRQRITVSCHINPLTRQETEKYIFHRLVIEAIAKLLSSKTEH